MPEFLSLSSSFEGRRTTSYSNSFNALTCYPRQLPIKWSSALLPFSCFMLHNSMQTGRTFYLLQELRIQTMLSVPAQRSPAVYHHLQKCIMQLVGGVWAQVSYNTFMIKYSWYKVSSYTCLEVLISFFFFLSILVQLCSVFMAAKKSILRLIGGKSSHGKAAQITGVDSRISGGNPVPCALVLEQDAHGMWAVKHCQQQVNCKILRTVICTWYKSR